MSVKITINTTIELPLSSVAAIQADDGGINNVQGMKDVSAAMNAAAVHAIKALPYRVHPSPTIAVKAEPPAAAGLLDKTREYLSETITIIVKECCGREHNLTVKRYYKIGKLKELLHEMTGLSIIDQSLRLQGRHMSNERTVADYKLSDGSTLILLFLVGGGI